MIQRRTTFGWAAAGAALTAVGLTLSVVGQASAVRLADSSWGRTGAYCYQAPLDRHNPSRYHITNIVGSPKEGVVKFDRTLERWDEAANGYTVVNTVPGWVQTVSENSSFSIDSFNMGDAGRACSNNFVVYSAPGQPDTWFPYGTWE
ncbi:MAG TPA: hypothetical protein VI248_01155 [Kineosporiaceae bacterium]